MSIKPVYSFDMSNKNKEHLVKSNAKEKFS